VQHTANPTLSLYNGNIARQTVAIAPFQRLEKQYIYDQLNRISSATYASVDATTSVLTGLNDYHNHYKYDQDGNITKLVRYGNKAGTPTPSVQLMDSFTYFYPKTQVNNQLQDITDSAVTSDYKNDIKHYTDTGNSRYMYDAIGNTTKDMVSGQDSIKWNLYNKVVEATDTAKKQKMQFMYDGAGNRVGKFVYTQTSAGTNEDDDFYIRDAQGNILAVYTMNRGYKLQYYDYNQFTLPARMNGDTRSGGGISDHGFNNSWTMPFFANNAYFSKALIAYSVGVGGQSNFPGTMLSGKPVSYYMTQNSSIYNNMLFSGAGYVNPLAAFEASHPDTVLTPAIMQLFNANDYLLGSQFIGALLSDTSITMKKHILELMSSTGNDSLTNYMATVYNAPIYTGSGSTTADAILPNLPQSNYDLFNTMRRMKDSMSATFHSYIHLLASDATIYADSFYVGTNGVLKPVIQRILFAHADTAHVAGFMNSWSNAGAQLLKAADTATLLKVVYTTDPLSYMNAVADNLGEAYIDSSIIQVPHLDPESYAMGLVSYVGGAGSTLMQAGGYVDEFLGETYSLAEHHLYGSSRLGVKQYWQGQFSNIFDYTKTPIYRDTLRLQTRYPWYSAEYQDGIAPTANAPYTNTYTDPLVTQHMIGLKHYELTDHLGDVLATVSDKRRGIDITGDSLIDIYRASIPTAYDYYPFGMLMPGRYTRDTTVHCAVITQTMLVPQWVWVDIPLFPGAATPLGPGTTLTWFSPISVTANSPAPMGGLAIAMSNLSVNGSSNISYTVNTLTGSWMGQVTDSTGAIIATQAVQGPGSFSLDFVPASTTATFSLLSTLPGGTINVAHPGYKTLIYVPGTVTRTLCDNEKDKYRFGFNGQEKDNEIAGVGNFTTAEYWEYDTRRAGRGGPDPVVRPWESPYAVFGGNPILNSDPNGDDFTDKNGKNVVAGEGITATPDGMKIMNSGKEKSWDYGTWNQESGSYDLHMLNNGNGSAPKSNFETANKYTLGFEGGYVNDRIDPGGATNKGITFNNFKKWATADLGVKPTLPNLKSLTDPQASTLYKKHYWDKINGDQFADGNVAFAVYDFSVNSGGGVKQFEKAFNKTFGGITVDGKLSKEEIGMINKVDAETVFNLVQTTRSNYINNVVIQNSVNNYLKSHPNASQAELKQNTLLKFQGGWMKRINGIKYKTN